MSYQNVSISIPGNNKKQENVALKRMTRDATNLELFDREVLILQKLDHRNIIHFIDCYMDKDHYYIATVLCSGGELFGRLLFSFSLCWGGLAVWWMCTRRRI